VAVAAVEAAEAAVGYCATLALHAAGNIGQVVENAGHYDARMPVLEAVEMASKTDLQDFEPAVEIHFCMWQVGDNYDVGWA
jgi:hypothetical protein